MTRSFFSIKAMHFQKKNLPFTELKLLYYKKSYQNFKGKRSEKDQLSGLPRKAELYLIDWRSKQVGIANFLF